MAETITLYDHTINRFASGANAASDTYKLILCTALTINTTHTQLSQITYTEVANGNGYTTGGATLQGVNFAQANTTDSRFDADDVQWTAGSSSLSATHALLVNTTDANSPPVAAINFDGTKTTPANSLFTVRWNADGIVRFRKPV